MGYSIGYCKCSYVSDYDGFAGGDEQINVRSRAHPVPTLDYYYIHVPTRQYHTHPF